MIQANQQYVDRDGRVGRIEEVLDTGTFNFHNNPLSSMPGAWVKDILGREFVVAESDGIPWEPFVKVTIS